MKMFIITSDDPSIDDSNVIIARHKRRALEMYERKRGRCITAIGSDWFSWIYARFDTPRRYNISEYDVKEMLI